MRNKKKIRNTLLLGLLVGFVLVPLLVSAQAFNTEDPLSSIEGGSGFFETVLNCAPEEGPLCLLKNVLMLLLSLALIVSVIFIVIGGYRYVTARGNEEAAEEAKKTMTHAIIGAIAIGASWVILSLIASFIRTGSPGGN